MPKTCPSCQASIGNTAKFCPECGEKFKSTGQSKYSKGDSDKLKTHIDYLERTLADAGIDYDPYEEGD